MRKLSIVSLLLAVILCSHTRAEDASSDDPLIAGSVNQKSQDFIGICGTEITPEQAAVELAREAEGWPSFKSPAAATLYAPLAIHIVRRSDGTGGLSLEQLYDAIKDLNYFWEPVGIQFFCLRDGTGEYLIDYIDSDEYFETVLGTSERYDLRHENPVPDAINTWFVPNTDVCGSSSYTSSAVQGIVMNNVCLGAASRTTWAHEVGHYFDLYHTHETYYGIECPDSSNCSSAGDKICDTQADPNVYGLVDYYCNYVGSEPTPDGCSGTYDPPVENIMSYSRKNCRTEFSPGQVSKVLNVMMFDRVNLFQYDLTDSDGDGVPDLADNCPGTANADQYNADLDPYGDDCDACLDDWINDADGDGLCTIDDTCPYDSLNDGDGDGYCADTDVCPEIYNPDQLDGDEDGIGDLCDACPSDPDNDIDQDGYCAGSDICPEVYNPNQLDGDEDGIGDLCDACPSDPDNDVDQDGYCAGEDNCPTTYNPDQADSNQDSVGDLCCCGAFTEGITGNANCSGDGKLTLSDVSRLIDRVYISKDPLCCEASGNTNGSTDCNITLSDITVLIDAVYISQTPPSNCIAVCGE